jgi:hypothetical protein
VQRCSRGRGAGTSREPHDRRTRRRPGIFLWCTMRQCKAARRHTLPLLLYTTRSWTDKMDSNHTPKGGLALNSWKHQGAQTRALQAVLCVPCYRLICGILVTRIAIARVVSRGCLPFGPHACSTHLTDTSRGKWRRPMTVQGACVSKRATGDLHQAIVPIQHHLVLVT